ncbi:WecB/TagA/CpsF family glycosyltransferase [Pigmentiphaga litoralis]|uniref:WecB/TagA/CpsF family glycosyltransferase n=1 Tax=Pigmentiphaga litoralis TaxID=516702 RepID=UPI003B43A93E
MKPAPSQPAGSIRLFDLNVRPVTLKQAVDLLAAWITERHSRGGVVVTPNVDHIVRMEKAAPEFRESYASAEFIFADGMPVVWASRLLGRPLPERVTGADLFVALCQEAISRNWRVSVIGGIPGTEKTLEDRFRDSYPGIDVQVHCPSMTFDPLGPEGQAAADLQRARARTCCSSAWACPSRKCGPCITVRRCPAA